MYRVNSFLIMEDADTNFVIESVQQQQIIFHPTIAPAGHIDYTKFFASKRKKPFILALDRNILSSLLKFCEKGSLKNSTEVRLIGLIMTWAEMNGVAISAGMAVRERASQMHSQEVGLVELQRFKEAFDAYPGQVWLRISEGQLIEVPPVQFSMKPAQNITVNYADSGDHYDMAVASLLHAVRLYRILNNSLYRPRDVIRMMSAIHNQIGTSEKFNQEAFDKAQQEYSELMWTEIKDELRLSYSEEEVNAIFVLLNRITMPFSYESLVKRIEVLGKYYPDIPQLLDSSKLIMILTKLYELGVIGNTGKPMNFVFLGRPALDPLGMMVIHTPLRNYFSVQYER